jgi:hypothetical protein
MTRMTRGAAILAAALAFIITVILAAGAPLGGPQTAVVGETGMVSTSNHYATWIGRWPAALRKLVYRASFVGRSSRDQLLGGRRDASALPGAMGASVRWHGRTHGESR